MEPLRSCRISADSRFLKLHTKGFTLVELLVVLAIIGVVMATVLSSQSSFNKTFILSNTAYDIALSLRNAQTFGLGSRAIGTTVNAGYGLHFESASPKSFLLFADTSPDATCYTPDCKPGDHAYRAGSDVLIQSYAIGNGISVTGLCAYSSSSWSCSGISSLDIAFSRPNPDPFLSVNGSYSQASPVTAACLTVSSPAGESRFISISSSGAILANAASCP